MTKTKSLVLGALALLAAGGAVLATTDTAEARRFGGFHYRHGLGLGLGLGFGLAAPVYAPGYALAAPVRVCRTRMVIYRGVLHPVRACRILAAY